MWFSRIQLCYGKILWLGSSLIWLLMLRKSTWWRYGDSAAKVDVYDVNATMMRFTVPNPKAREKILQRGMLNIAGVPMVVSKWTPKIEEEKQEEEAIPMWVHLKNVPLHMFSWETLSFITSSVGFPV